MQSAGAQAAATAAAAAGTGTPGSAQRRLIDIIRARPEAEAGQPSVLSRELCDELLSNSDVAPSLEPVPLHVYAMRLVGFESPWRALIGFDETDIITHLGAMLHKSVEDSKSGSVGPYDMPLLCARIYMLAQMCITVGSPLPNGFDGAFSERPPLFADKKSSSSSSSSSGDAAKIAPFWPKAVLFSILSRPPNEIDDLVSLIFTKSELKTLAAYLKGFPAWTGRFNRYNVMRDMAGLAGTQINPVVVSIIETISQDVCRTPLHDENYTDMMMTAHTFCQLIAMSVANSVKLIDRFSRTNRCEVGRQHPQLDSAAAAAAAASNYVAESPRKRQATQPPSRSSSPVLQAGPGPASANAGAKKPWAELAGPIALERTLASDNTIDEDIKVPGRIMQEPTEIFKRIQATIAAAPEDTRSALENFNTRFQTHVTFVRGRVLCSKRALQVLRELAAFAIEHRQPWSDLFLLLSCHVCVNAGVGTKKTYDDLQTEWLSALVQTKPINLPKVTDSIQKVIAHNASVAPVGLARAADSFSLLIRNTLTALFA